MIFGGKDRRCSYAGQPSKVDTVKRAIIAFRTLSKLNSLLYHFLSRTCGDALSPILQSMNVPLQKRTTHTQYKVLSHNATICVPFLCFLSFLFHFLPYYVPCFPFLYSFLSFSFNYLVCLSFSFHSSMFFISFPIISITLFSCFFLIFFSYLTCFPLDHHFLLFISFPITPLSFAFPFLLCLLFHFLPYNLHSLLFFISCPVPLRL